LTLDSLLSWQRRCDAVGGITICQRANAWGASGAPFGILMGAFAVATVGVVAFQAAGHTPRWHRSVLPFLISGTVVFGGAKFGVVLTRFPAFGAWVGLVLLLALAGGALRWSREAPD